MADLVDPRLGNSNTILLMSSTGHYPVSRDRLIGHGKCFEKALAVNPTPKSVPCADMRDMERAMGKDALATYVAYLHRGTLEKSYFAKGGTELAQVITYDIGDLINLYLVCHKIEDLRGQEDCIDAILASYRDQHTAGKRWLPDSKTIDLVYVGTKPSSTLRKFIVDAHVWARDTSAADKSSSWTFLRDLSEALDDHRRKTLNDLRSEVKMKMEGAYGTPQYAFPNTVSSCHYHQHAPGEEDECGNKKRKRAALDTGEDLHD